MPSRYSLSVYRGDTYSWQFILWNDAAQTDPYDLTNVTAKAEIRDQPGGSVIVPLDLTIELPNTIFAALDMTNSPNLPTPSGVWDLQLTDTAAGSVTTVLAGGVTVTPDVTDSTPEISSTVTTLRRVA